MKKSHIYIMVGVVVLCLILVFAATASSVSKSHGSFNYKNIHTENSFKSYFGFTQTPAAGATFVVVDVVLENKDYGEGLYLTSSNFDLIIDGTTYSASYSDTLLTSLNPGIKGAMKIAYEVPLGISISGASISWDGYPRSVTHDSNLSFPI